MRRYHKALVLVAVCSTLLAAGLVRAVVYAPRALTTSELLAATRRAVDESVEAAIATGGLEDGESFVEERLAALLHRQGFRGAVDILRPNDVNPWAAFYFLVEVGALTLRFDLEGTRDPLLAIRMGQDLRIRADPFHPYTTHREPAVLAACLSRHLFHFAPEGPDFFARLENLTTDPYHFGFESFLGEGADLAVDHEFLATRTWGLDAIHRARYGL